MSCKKKIILHFRQSTDAIQLNSVTILTEFNFFNRLQSQLLHHKSKEQSLKFQSYRYSNQFTFILTPKNILIIGASSGIGHALAQKISAQGHQVFTASRRQPENLPDAHWFSYDATSPFQLPADFPDTLHGLVYCPGTINLKPISRLTTDDFKTDFQVNVLGFVEAVQATLRQLKKAGNASVLAYSTVAVQTGMGFHASVAASKGALEGLARSLAAELAPSHIRVNVVAPSLTDTPLAAALLSTPEKLEASGKRHPLGRVGTAEDIAAMSAFLLSDESGWITGQVLHVDGGMGNLK